MDDLREHPQIEELMDALEKNNMLKEKAEVESLVNYIGDMEKTLTEMLKEMKNMRQEINLIHNGTLKAKCELLVQKTEVVISKAVEIVKKVKDNLVQAAKNAVKALKEKGREAFQKAVRAMKVPETLDMLTGLFLICSKEADLDNLILNLYKGLADDIIDGEEYKLLNKKYLNEKKLVEEEIKRVNEEIFKMRRWIDSFEHLGEKFNDLLSDSIDGQAIIDELIESVCVSSKGEIEITFKCQDIIERFRELAGDENEEDSSILETVAV